MRALLPLVASLGGLLACSSSTSASPTLCGSSIAGTYTLDVTTPACPGGHVVVRVAADGGATAAGAPTMPAFAWTSCTSQYVSPVTSDAAVCPKEALVRCTAPADAGGGITGATFFIEVDAAGQIIPGDLAPDDAGQVTSHPGSYMDLEGPTRCALAWAVSGTIAAP